MIVEVEGRRLELGWREAAAVLVMRFVGWGALTLSDLELVTGNYVTAAQAAARLKALGLVEELTARGFKLYRLTELGAKVADELKRRAESTGIWRLAEEALGGA